MVNRGSYLRDNCPMGRQTDERARQRVAAFVREQMRARNIKHRNDLAELAGLNPTTVGTLLNGKRRATTDTTDAVEDALGLARGELQAMYDEDQSSQPVGAGLSQSSEAPASVEQTERNVVKVSAQAIGWELSATFTDAADRVRALEDISRAWAAMMGGPGTGGDSSADRGA